MKKFFIALFFTVMSMQSFTQGVCFRSLDFNQALNIAVKENKFVFVDFYTKWCGPCKKMLNNVFTQKDLGNYFNSAFISIKIDAESKDGINIAKEYKVSGYPTFIIFDGNKKELFRSVGYHNADELLLKVKRGIDPAWSVVSVANRYKSGERTPELINYYAQLLKQNGDFQNSREVINEYYSKLSEKGKVAPSNLFLYTDFTISSRDVKAQYIFDHKERFVENNSLSIIDSLLYRWSKQELMSFCILKPEQDSSVTKDSLLKLKHKVYKVRLTNHEELSPLFEIADVFVENDIYSYLDKCKSTFPLLSVKDRIPVLIGFSCLYNEDSKIKNMAAAIISKYKDGIEGFNLDVIQGILLKLGK